MFSQGWFSFTDLFMWIWPLRLAQLNQIWWQCQVTLPFLSHSMFVWSGGIWGIGLGISPSPYSGVAFELFCSGVLWDILLVPSENVSNNLSKYTSSLLAYLGCVKSVFQLVAKEVYLSWLVVMQLSCIYMPSLLSEIQQNLSVSV